MQNFEDYLQLSDQADAVKINWRGGDVVHCTSHDGDRELVPDPRQACFLGKGFRQGFFAEAFHANINGPRPCVGAPLDGILRAGNHLGSSFLRNGPGTPTWC